MCEHGGFSQIQSHMLSMINLLREEKYNYVRKDVATSVGTCYMVSEARRTSDSCNMNLLDMRIRVMPEGECGYMYQENHEGACYN